MKQGSEDISYERLEFLGDAILGAIIAEYLFREYPDLDSGKLSRAKAHFVSEERLAEVARYLQLGELIQMSKGEEKGGGREKNSVLSDALEAFIGAIYLLGGLAKARRFVMRSFKPLFKTIKRIFLKDYKSILQEYLQGKGRGLPQYQVVKTEGPPHERIFTVQVKIEGEIYGEGVGRNKKEASMAAAKMALKKLGLNYNNYE